MEGNKECSYIVRVNLLNNTFERLNGDNRLFNDKNLDTFDKLVYACANDYILDSDKVNFIKRLDRRNIYESIRTLKYIIYGFKVIKNEKVIYFSVKVIKENDFNSNKEVVIYFEKASKEAYLQIEDEAFYEAIAAARLNNFPVILVTNYQDEKLKVFTNGDPQAGYISWDNIKKYEDLVNLVLGYVDNKSRALESLNLKNIKEVLYNNKNHYETILAIGTKNKVFIKFDYTSVIVRNEKYIVIALCDDTYEVTSSLTNPRLSNQEMSIYKALTKEFTSLFIVGFHTGKTSYYAVDSNSNFKEIMSCKKLSESINIYIKNYVHDDDKERIYRIFNFENLKMMLEKKNHLLIQFKKVKDGLISHAIFSISLVKLENDEDKIVIAVRPINQTAENEIRQKEILSQMLDEKIQFDDLTRLYNRSEFIKVCSEKLRLSNSNDNYHIIEFDIDRFSVFNDLFGLNQGDIILKNIADYLITSDKEYDVSYARLSNDIFAVLIKGSEDNLTDYIMKLKNYTKELYEYFEINLSIGVYKILDKTLSIETMLDYCKQAAKTIKKKYVKTYAIYNQSMFEARVAEQKVINRMNQALVDKEFHIYLQPKYDIYKNELVGAEALVRWVKDDQVVPPSQFIPIFEQNGFITKLDYYVWEETLKYLKWRMDNNLKLFPISVNVSRTFLTIPNFKSIILNLVNKYKIEPKYFELEITETLFSDIDLIRDKVNDLRKLGFKILMDDFGSGYSSLNVLKDVDFDVLKIDLKFFSNDSKKSQKIIEAVINLAHELNIPAIAEGVETVEYIDMLKKYGCQYAQGYYYDKPMNINKFNEKYN